MQKLFLLLAMAAGTSAQTTPVLSQAEIQQLETKVAQNPQDRSSSTLLGKNYAFYMLGITSLKKYDMVEGVDPAKAASPFAGYAASQLNASNDAVVVGEGGNALWGDSFQVMGVQSLHGTHDDSTLLAARRAAVAALDRAISLDATDPAWRKYRIPIVILRTSLNNELKLTTSQAYDSVKQDLAVLEGMDRRFMVSSAAKLALKVGALDDAQALAQEVLDSVSAGDWDSGNAVFFGNMVLGQVALRRGDKDAARSRLLASGKTHGSPQLDSFGPNMSLAKEMVEAGEKATVVAFFELCRSFWKMDRGNLDRWSAQVTAGKVPEFGANLSY